MFERFTERARKALKLANLEAQRFNCARIDPEHVLLGILGQQSGIGMQVLRELNVEPDSVLRETERALGEPGSIATAQRLPPSPQAQNVIKHAIEAARSLNCNYVGTEHLLLGLLDVVECVPYKVFAGFGISRSTATQAVCDVLGISTDSGKPQPPDERYPFENFSDRSRRVIARAHLEAQQFGHTHCANAHVLLALAQEGSGTCAKVLEYLNLDPSRICHEVENLMNVASTPSQERIPPHVPGAQTIIDHAINEAHWLGCDYVGTEHLLLAMCYDPTGIPCRVFSRFGVAPDGVRKAVCHVLGIGTDSS